MPSNFLRKCTRNALICAGLSFFVTLASISAVQVIADPRLCLISGGISAGLGFFISLRIQIGKASDEFSDTNDEVEIDEK